MLFAVIERPGRAAADVLAEAVGAHRRATSPGPSRCAGATATLRWVRPLHGIVALLGEDIVPVEVDGIASGATTVGHRFHHPGAITIGGAQRLCREIARLPRDRRPGRARAADPRRRGEGRGGGGADVARRRGAGGRECRADRMAGAAARPVRRRLSRRAARGDRAHHAHQPEIFRLHRRRRRAGAGVRVRRQHRRERRRRGDRRGQSRGCSPRGSPTRASSGSRI